MNIAEQSKRIHPLVAVAAAAVTVFSLVGIAAITGLLPSSWGTGNDGSRDNLQTSAQYAPNQASNDNWEEGKPVVKKLPQKATTHATSGSTTVASAGSAQPAPVPAQPAPVAKKEPHNSAVGIGVGAVVGGVLGNQVGSGDGKTLATILGAVGGGYVGNEIAKKNQ